VHYSRTASQGWLLAALWP